MTRKRQLTEWEKWWRLSFIKELEQTPRRMRRVRCECACGTIKDFMLPHLLSWSIKSCWCITKKHWMCETRFYHIFHLMNQRCKNPRTKDYKYYWWRGIKCEWNDFISFMDDMLVSYNIHTNKHWEWNTTLERVDYNWNYSKTNCVWETKEKQAYNKSNTIKYKGKSLSEWCRILDIKYCTARDRIKNRWKSIEEVLWF